MGQSECGFCGPTAQIDCTGLELKDAEDRPMTFVTQMPVGRDRLKVLSEAFSAIREAKHVVSVYGKGETGEAREFIAVAKENDDADPKLVMACCQITFADITPGECMEYAFSEQPGVFRVSEVSLEALESYRGTKFKAWENMLRHPECEAQFRRMLQIGCVTGLYDTHLFPTPPDLSSQFEVVDERTGKTIQLPHPVAELRTWDAEQQAYRKISAHTEGAPMPQDKDAWWAGFVEELEEKLGKEYVQSFM